MKKFIKPIIFIALAVTIFLVIRFTPLKQYFVLEDLLERKEAFLEAVNERFFTSALIFIGAYFVVVAATIPGATVLTLLGGFLFGAVRATILINIGATTGAFAIFLISRYLLGDWFQKKYAENLKKFNDEMAENGKNYMIMLRLVPLFPFFMINILAGLTKIPATTYLWTTALGIIPGSFVYAYIGYTSASLKGSGGLNPNIVISFVLLGLLSLIPVVVKKIRKRKEKING